jgi:hypothetical protein
MVSEPTPCGLSTNLHIPKEVDVIRIVRLKSMSTCTKTEGMSVKHADDAGQWKSL